MALTSSSALIEVDKKLGLEANVIAVWIDEGKTVSAFSSQNSIRNMGMACFMKQRGVQIPQSICCPKHLIFAQHPLSEHTYIQW